MNTRRLSLAFALFAALLAAGDSPSAVKEKIAPPAPGPAKGVVPFELLPSNHMIVRAKLNGKGPFRLIFDLGAPMTLLSNKAAEAAGVVKKDAPRSILFAMRGEAAVDTLEVGGLSVKGLPVVVLDHPALKMLGGLFTRPPDGIIGFTLFARYKTTIDYQAREMTFEPVAFAMRDLMKDLPQRLAGPKEAKRLILAPSALFGLNVADPADPLSAPGVTITSVLPDSPAAAAGFKPGDLLASLDGRWTTSIVDAYAAAAGAEPARAVEAVVVRDGQTLTLSVTPREGF